MTIEDALRLVDKILVDKRLNNVQELLFRQAWEGETYAKIAEKSGYDASYVRDVGYKLWQSLSQQIGERVTKSNVQVVFRRHAARLLPMELGSRQIEPSISRIDWGNAIAPTIFLGRQSELKHLVERLLDPNCHLVGIFGMGGIGKTALAIKLVEQVRQNFDLICWRSLRNAPPLVDLLADLIQFLSNEPLPLHLLPSLQDNRETRRYRQGQLLSMLLQLLQEYSCLLVLDGIEAVLRPRAIAGEYLEHYESYGELFQQVADSRHQSSILITSREQPQSLIPWETDPKIYGWQLQGLGEDAIALLPQNPVAAEITTHYSGNPLALKIAVSGIQELFDGDIQAFWQERATIFGGIRQLLSQHSDRLSGIEAQVIIWLALRQVPMSVADLQAVTTTSKSQLLEALSSLLRRSLAHRSNSGFTISPMMSAYVNEQLAEQLCSDLIAGVSSTLCQYAITSSTTGSEPNFSEILLLKLLSYFGSRHSLNEMLVGLHSQLRQSNQVGYGIENLRHLQAMLTTSTTSLKCIEFPPTYSKRSDTFNFHARA